MTKRPDLALRHLWDRHEDETDEILEFIEYLQTEKARLAAELAGARRVLDWYADDRNYGRPGGPDTWAAPVEEYYVVEDDGERARRFLRDCAPDEGGTKDV